MATKNLGLTTISGSDYVSYEVINKNFELLDKLGIDYVTSTGTSGIWTYRKWKSGYAEFWGKKSFAATSTAGNLSVAATYPFKMVNGTVHATVSGGVSGRNDAHISYVSTDASQVDAYIAKPTTTNLPYWAFYHCEGKMA
jgi:hypothetical protein